METISQREMRNNSSRVLAAVRAGESFTVTNDGVPVAMLVPIAERAKPPISHPARRPGAWDRIRPRHIEGPSVQEILDDLRGDR